MYLMGIDPTSVRTSTQVPEFAVGQRGGNVTSTGFKEYIYVQDSGSAITGDGYVVIIGADFKAVMASTTTAAAGTGQGKMAGVARAAIAASGYGWVQIFGSGTIRTLASCAAYTNLNVTATAGAIDDDATSTRQVIDGMVLSTATGGATANTAGLLSWPRVGRTL